MGSAALRGAGRGGSGVGGAGAASGVADVVGGSGAVEPVSTGSAVDDVAPDGAGGVGSATVDPASLPPASSSARQSANCPISFAPTSAITPRPNCAGRPVMLRSVSTSQ